MLGQNKNKNCVMRTGMSLSGSETDVSTSTENLSQEERYVIRHMARQDPQGQEKPEPNDINLSPHAARQQSLDNASSYNTLIIHATGEDGISPWTSLTASSSQRDSYISTTSSHGKSGTAGSPSSSSTLLGGLSSQINATSLHLSEDSSRLLRDITEIPDDYLSQSHVLKHLAKEVKVVTSDSLLEEPVADYENHLPRRLLLLDLSPETHSRIIGNRYSTPVQPPPLTHSKLCLSRSQPDLSQVQEGKAVTPPSDEPSRSSRRKDVPGRPDVILPTSNLIQLLLKENSSLKAELESCYKKVSKSQKLEQEVANIHQSHHELMQSFERREKLEREARQKLHEENRVLRQQYELLLRQLEHSSSSSAAAGSSEEAAMLRQEISHRDTLLMQLMSQNKELTGCRERQEIELAAQRATLQEQRTHIDILDTALTNAQANVMRLEEECRKRQIYEERVVQLQQSLSSLQLAREQLEGEINDLRVSRRVNNAAAQTASFSSSSHKDSKGEDNSETLELRQRLREKDERLMNMEREIAHWQQLYLEENALRQAIIDTARIPRDAKIAALEKSSLESERLMAEARTEKIRHLDEFHGAQRKIADLESRVQELVSRLAEKDAMVTVLQAAHHHHHSSLYTGSGAPSNPSARSSHHYLHHSSASSSSYHRQPSPSSLGCATGSVLRSLGSGSKCAMDAADLIATSKAMGVSTPPSLAAYQRSYSNMRTPTSGLGFTGKNDYGSGSSAGASSTISSSCSTSQLLGSPKESKVADDQLQNLDTQLLSGRVLCCFSGGFPARRSLATTAAAVAASAGGAAAGSGPAGKQGGRNKSLLVGMKQRNPSPSPVNQLEDNGSNKIKFKHDDQTTKDSKDLMVSYVPKRYKTPIRSSPKQETDDNNKAYRYRTDSPSSSLQTNSNFTSQTSFDKDSQGAPTPQDETSELLYDNADKNDLLPLISPATGQKHQKSSSFSENSKTFNDILLLEKQGRTSQKQRRSSAGSQVMQDEVSSRSNTSSNWQSSAIPKCKPSVERKKWRMQSGGYNLLDESDSNNVTSTSTTKVRMFQPGSRKCTPPLPPDRQTQSNVGMKYRIQL